VSAQPLRHVRRHRAVFPALPDALMRILKIVPRTTTIENY
jgi:hypothetical protein